jgi:hypothetical protein
MDMYDPAQSQSHRANHYQLDMQIEPILLSQVPSFHWLGAHITLKNGCRPALLTPIGTKLCKLSATGCP